MVQNTKLEMSTDHRMGEFLMLWESQIDGRPVHGASRLAIQFYIDISMINHNYGAQQKIKLMLV
jgi:hypothetical protein